MCAFVQTTLVANDLARIESRASPRRRLSRVTIEAPPTEILSLLGSRIICMLDGKTCMGREVGHHRVMRRRNCRAVEGGLGGDHNGSGIFQLDRVGVIEFVVRRMRRRVQGRNKVIVLKPGLLSRQLKRLAVDLLLARWIRVDGRLVL